VRHPIGQTRNDIAVYVDLTQSQAAKHIAQQPHLLSLVAEALPQITLRGAEARIEHDMGRAVGYSFVVKTADSESVFYAQLLRDDTYTRFVKNGKPLPTQYVSMLLNRDESGEYALHDVWLGRLNPPRPGTADETAESKPYWATHAIVLGNEALQLRTITKVCPY
jgi:hypothetical protein